MADEVFTVGYRVDSSGVEGDAEAAGKAAKAAFEKGFGALDLKPKIDTEAIGKALQAAAAKLQSRDEGGRFAGRVAEGAGEAGKAIKGVSEETEHYSSKMGLDLAKAAAVGVAGMGTLRTALTGLTEFMASGSFSAATHGLTEFTESAARTGEATGGIGASVAKAAPYITAFTLTAGAAAVGTKEMAERGADAVLTMDALTKSSALGLGPITGLSKAAGAQGLELSELARGLGRLNLQQVRARREIERQVTEEPRATADAQEAVVKAYRAREAATDAVGTAEDKVIRARGAVAAQRAGGLAEAQIAEVQGPLTVRGAEVAAAGAGAGAESAGIAQRQAHGEFVGAEEIRQARIDQADAAAASAGYNAEQARLNLEKAEVAETERAATTRAEGGAGGVAALNMRETLRGLSEAMRGLGDAREGIPAANRAIGRSADALDHLHLEQITGVAEMIRQRDPGLAGVDPQRMFQAMQQLGEGRGGGLAGTLSVMQDFIKDVQSRPAGAAETKDLQSATSAMLGQIFGTRGPQSQVWQRLLGGTDLQAALGHEPTAAEREKYGPEKLRLAVDEQRAEKELQTNITSDAIASMSKTVPLVAEGFDKIGQAFHGILTGTGLVPPSAEGEGGGGGAGGVGGFVGEHPVLSAVGGYLGLKGAGAVARTGAAAGGSALWAALFGEGAGVAAGAGVGAGVAAGAAEGAAVGSFGGPVGIGVGVLAGAVIAYLATKYASGVGTKPEEGAAKPPPETAPTPADSATTPITVQRGAEESTVRVPFEGQAPVAPVAPIPAAPVAAPVAAPPVAVPAVAAPAGGQELSGAAAALNGAAGALSGAAGALSGAASALSSSSHSAPPAPDSSATAASAPKEVTAQEQAAGGLIHGSGDATSDSIPIMASPHEYIVKASSVRQYGVPLLDRLNAGHFAMGGLIRGYAEGGLVKQAEDLGMPREVAEKMDDAGLERVIAEAGKGTSWLDAIKDIGVRIGSAVKSATKVQSPEEIERQRQAMTLSAGPPTITPHAPEPPPVPIPDFLTTLHAGINTGEDKSKSKLPPPSPFVQVDRHGEQGKAKHQTYNVPEYTADTEATEKARGFTFVGGADIDLTKPEKSRFADIDVRDEETKAAARPRQPLPVPLSPRSPARTHVPKGEPFVTMETGRVGSRVSRELEQESVGQGTTEGRHGRRHRDDDDSDQRLYALGGLVPARVSSGEYRMSAPAVGRLGVGFMRALNAGRFAGGGLISGAAAGAVGTETAALGQALSLAGAPPSVFTSSGLAGAGAASTFAELGMGPQSGLPVALQVARALGSTIENTLNLVTHAGEFNVNASSETIEAIRASALGAQLTSTGTRPSWY